MNTKPVMLEVEDLKLILVMIDFYYERYGSDLFSESGETRIVKLQESLKMELLYWNCGR